MAVVALGMMSDNHMDTAITSASTAQTGKSPAVEMIPFAISPVPPEASSACPMGIIAPSSTITGHSMPEYRSH
jgi:hypothetical protein